MDKTEILYSGICVGDIHFGALPANKLFSELNEGLINYIKEINILDFVILDGDYYDKIISLDSLNAKYSISIIKTLMILSKEKNFKIRILQGTRSHDNDQLKILENLNKDNIYDFKVIYEVTEEELFPEVNVLYIPEEYMEKQEEYYKDTIYNKEKAYDMIFMHGMVTDAAFVGMNQTSENMSKCPIIDTNILLERCYGPIIAGHIHTNMCIKKRFFYIGSYSRWRFGEEEDKGFYHVMYSPINKKFNMNFIKNENAEIYKTVTVNNIPDDKITDEVIDTISYIVTNELSNNVDKLRIKMIIPENYYNPNLLINTVKEMYANNKSVKIVITNESKENQKKKIRDKIKKQKSEYDFLFKKEMSFEEKISKFIKVKFNKEIDEDKIRKVIYKNM